MKKIILILTVVLTTAIVSYSQKSECGTVEPDRSAKQLAEEDKMFVADNGNRFIVPVIFHLVYKHDSQNIPDEQLLALLETLQADFLVANSDISLIPGDFRPLVGNPNVKFVLADRLPNGDKTNGIIRKLTSINKFKFRERKIFRESLIIDSARYLNVYVCNLNTNGFRPVEGETTPSVDGVVIDVLRAKKGIRTLTHEVGHWFNLSHIFGGGSCGNDYVPDTPKQKKHSHSRHDHPLEECGNRAVMFMNFMDYSFSRIFFTDGQVKRMRKYILLRKPLLQIEK